MLAAEARQGDASVERAVATEDAAARRRLAAFDVAWIFVVIGAFLRIYQYAWNRSLFIDEAALALNLRTHGFAELLGRLDHAQFGPLGFLYLQKVLRELFGESEYVLRAPALLAGLLSLPLFLLLARRVLPRRASWLAVALLAFTPAAIFWSVDAKSYAIDMLATIVLALLALDFWRAPGRSTALRLGIAGAGAPYFSSASFLVLGGFGLALVVRGWRERRREVLAVILIWLAALPALLHSQMSLSPADKAYFRADWWEGFLPLPWAAGAPGAYTQQVFRTLYDPLGFGRGWPAYVGLTAIVAGAIWLARNERKPASLAAITLLVVWCASMAGLYPLGQFWQHYGRVLLFGLPFLTLCMAAAVAWLKVDGLATVVGGALVFIIAVPAVVNLPYTRGEARRALAYVAANARPDDVVYLYYSTALPVEYYRLRVRANVVEGVCAQDDRAAYLRDLERLRGRPRVWVVTAYNTLHENFLIEDYMRRNAVTLDSFGDYLGDARLYDFTGAARQPPATRWLHPPFMPYEGTPCGGIFAAGWQRPAHTSGAVSREDGAT